MSNFNCQNYVGRVDISGYKTGKPYTLSQDLGVNSKGGFENSLEHYLEETDVSRYFFSKENIELLQKAITGNVNKRLELQRIDYKVGSQNRDNLHIVMRAMYLQEACHFNCKLADQIKTLNGKVLDYVIPNIITNVKQYVGYIKDISSTIPIMNRSTNTSSKTQNKEMQPDIGFVSFSK